MRRGLRLALWGWFFTGLVALAYAGVVFASSAPLAESAARAMAHPGENALAPGESVLLVPPSALKAALDTSAPDSFGARGSVVAWRSSGAAPSGSIPGFEEARNVGRVLARATWNATAGAWAVSAGAHPLAENVTRVDLVGVPAFDANGTRLAPTNLSVDLSPLGARDGWIVKADNAPDVSLVEDGRLRGEVASALPTAAIETGLIVAAVGTVVPLALLVLGHEARPAKERIELPAREGAKRGPDVACPECGKPVASGATFCLRCGALVPESKP